MASLDFPRFIVNPNLGHHLRSGNDMRHSIGFPMPREDLKDCLIHGAVSVSLRHCIATDIGRDQNRCMCGGADLRGKKHQQNKPP